MSSFLPHRKHYGIAFSYSVFPCNGDEATTVDAVFPNDKYDALATEPTWAHHRFLGWFDQAGTPDVTGTTVGNGVSAADDVLLERAAVYGQWQLPASVTFDATAGGGSMDPWDHDYYEGQPFGELPDAAKAGELFDGWFLDGTRVTAATVVPAGGATLVAQFEVIQRVEYLESDGNGPYIDTRAGVKILDLVPVRVGTTGYMQDQISGRLLGNVSDSGAFVYGPDVAEGGS